ncbi:MAG: hypothetical protein IKU69_00895 [Roseburia sp.]|nr:hypothetical protein [Roseburia sp.]
MKKMSLIMCAVLVCTLMAGCGGKNPQVESGSMQDTQVSVETQETEQSSKTESDALLDQFLVGEISADGNDLYYEETFYISDLSIDVEDWQSYSIGERLDLDNDADNEQVLNGPYGGIYLDASDGKVKVLACGEGTARNLSYKYFEGEVWIVYSDVMHVGRTYYFLEKYYGADDLAETISLERYEEEDCVTYYLNGQEVTSSIYEHEYEKFFGTYEVYDPVMDTEIVDEGSSAAELYEAFLNNEISVANPYVDGDTLSVMTDEDYDGEFDGAEKRYAFVDMNRDEQEELIFKITASPSELMMILGVVEGELICFDVMETHTKTIEFSVYDFGLAWKDESYDHFVRGIYHYGEDGQPSLIRTFTEGDEASMETFAGDEPEWMDWSSFSGL